MFSKFAALFSLAAVVRSAQINVTVGGPGVLKYNPESVTANPGDVVVFTFMQKNHTATQSTFAEPCQQAPGGFDSGFVPVANTSTGPFPVAQFTVQDTNPVWVYCRQTGHCQQGMVFAINPGDKFAAFQAAATGNSSTSSSASSSATITSATAPAQATATISVSGQAVTTTYSSFPGSAAPTSGVSTDHQVIVGADGTLMYSPANITAQIGDTVTFQFQTKNHTITQSSFAAPCRALASTSTNGQVGFDSGFMPVANGTTNFPTYTIQINDTAPVWAYCRQTGHCGQGMVFAVNAVESSANNFDAFVNNAKQQNGTSTPSASGASPSASGKGNGATATARGLGGVFVPCLAVMLGLVL